eukprot:gene9499-9662_t
MQKAFSLGVISYKSAGNQGSQSSQGLFWVDAFTGAGSTMVAAADTSSGVVGAATASFFSSYGPDANLNLLPTISAPGSNIITTTGANTVGETGFTDANPEFPSAVSKSGAGLVNFAAAYYNPIEISPSYISLPSGLQGEFNVTITLRNNMKRMAGQKQTYRYYVRHRQQAAALDIQSEWGQSPVVPQGNTGARVTLSRRWVALAPGQTATLTASFTLPGGLRSSPLLYSGYIDLRPTYKTGNATATWAPNDRWKAWWKFNVKSSPLPGPRFLTIPYQGVSRPYSSLPLVPLSEDSSLYYSQPGICYARNSKNSLYPRFAMDVAYDVNACYTNTADRSSDITIPKDRLNKPCELRITLAPQIPVRRIQLDLLDRNEKKVGSLPTLETPVLSRAPAYDPSTPEGGTDSSTNVNVYSYCLGWKGKYKPVTAASANASESVKLNTPYKLAAILEAPLAAGDRARLNKPQQVRIFDRIPNRMFDRFLTGSQHRTVFKAIRSSVPGAPVDFWTAVAMSAAAG